MLKKLLLLPFPLFTCVVLAQPYVDLANARYTRAFTNPDKNATPFSHLYIGSDIPIQLKNQVYIILSPYYESWNIDSASDKHYLPMVSSISFPVSMLFPIVGNKWVLTATEIHV